MGVVGAFIGPVVAGVFTTLLRIFKQQLRRYTSPPPPGLAPAQGVMPEAMTAPEGGAS
jgi:hypothetical protein